MTPEQLALRDTVRTLLAKKPDDLWPHLCEIGVLPIPERYGGSGAELADTHVVLEELGRVLSPAPLLSTTIAVAALLATGNDDACGRLLPRIAEGAVATVIWPWDCAEIALDGTFDYVLDGDIAEILLVSDGVSLHEVDLGAVTRDHTPTMDQTRRLATIQLTAACTTRLGPWSDRIRDVACAALSAEQVGAAARALELTVGYTKTRVQFGRPIGSFQALKHRMADMHVLVETARSASLAATGEVSAAMAADGRSAGLAATDAQSPAPATTDQPSAPPAAPHEVSAAVAKVYCSEAFCKVAAEMIQLHGGIAITWEHDAHRYFKRAHGSARLFGSPQEHLARLG